MSQLADYDDVREQIKEQWRKSHQILGFVFWRPFQNERHFNHTLGAILTELDMREDLVDYSLIEGSHEDAETEVIAEIIDVIVAKEFPRVNENNVVVRIAIHFVVVELVKILREEKEGLRPRTKVERWLAQWKVAGA